MSSRPVFTIQNEKPPDWGRVQNMYTSLFCFRIRSAKNVPEHRRKINGALNKNGEIDMNPEESNLYTQELEMALEAELMGSKGGFRQMDDCFKVKGTNLTIVVPMELDHHSAEKIKTGADKIVQGKNIRSIVFDFGKTNFMDSSGIGMIMGRYKDMRFMGGTVIAVRVNERVRRILTLSGIYKMIEIYEGLPQQSTLN